MVTGAGISAESGIPTYRGAGGYWQGIDPTKLATTTAFRAEPALVWQWYRERRDMIRRTDPNAAHVAVVRLANSVREFLLLTQNVDDLHQRAVWQDRRLSLDEIVPIHGNIFVTQCLRCDFHRKESAEDAADVPQCPECGRELRPGVVWFDEELNPDEVSRVERFLAGGPCDVVLVIGTTATFDYVVNWTLAAKQSRGQLIEINPEESAISKFATEHIRESAAVALPRLVDDWLRV